MRLIQSVLAIPSQAEYRHLPQTPLYQGPGRPGPGRPKSYDGKVDLDDPVSSTGQALSRFECVTSEDGTIVLYHQVLNHVHLRRNLRVVLAAGTHTRRRRAVCSAPIPTWMRRRFIVATKRVSRTCPGLDPGSSFFSETPSSLRLSLRL